MVAGDCQSIQNRCIGLQCFYRIGSSRKAAAAGESKTLVVYFSMPETTTADNMTTEEDNSVVVIDGEVLGILPFFPFTMPLALAQSTAPTA